MDNHEFRLAKLLKEVQDLKEELLHLQASMGIPPRTTTAANEEAGAGLVRIVAHYPGAAPPAKKVDQVDHLDELSRRAYEVAADQDDDR